MADELNKSPLINVVRFPGHDVNDIPQRLRDLAELLEQGGREGALSGMEDTQTFVWINVTSAGHIESGALGRIHGKSHVVGVMQAAIHKLLSGDVG